ncbi:MAG: hypothetical protein PHP45_03495 [Elusimicrobiales bacterium]|nr:hypothetical protein [Elusimicrobiales bacterium]
MAFKGVTICALHSEIRAELDELSMENISNNKIQRRIRIIVALLNKAIDSGQRMEDCIVRHREALEQIAKTAVNSL